MAAIGVTAPASAESVQLELLRPSQASFSGETTSKDFYFQLPEHVLFTSGSEITAALSGEPLLMALVSHIEVLVNGRRVSSQSLDGKKISDPRRASLRVSTQVPAGYFQAGWNRVGLHFIFRATAKVNHDFLTATKWTITRNGSSASVSYQRAEMFPELRRFPAGLAEEKLLHPGLTNNRPTVALLIPARPRDAHLRACAIIGARLGQLSYLSDADCRLDKLENWKAEIAVCNGLMLGCRDELDQSSLPSDIAAIIQQLKPGEGFLAENIWGAPGRQRRWVIVSGADDDGLEKAVLTLGHAPALASSPPNPAVIEKTPEIGNDLEPVNTSLAAAKTKGFSCALGSCLKVFGFGKNTPKANAGSGLSGSTRNSNGHGEIIGGSHAGLEQFQNMMLDDKFLRKTAFLIPKSASAETLKLMFDSARYLGRQLADAPVLWPEACYFSRGSAPPAERLQGRSVLLLGPVGEWKHAVPGKARFSIEVIAPESGLGRVQGRAHKLGEFEPSLAFMNLVRSPWSGSDWLIAVGGWLEVPENPVKNLLRDSARNGVLRGNLCAMDATGRFAACDTRKPMLTSFAEILRRNIPQGLTVDETAERMVDYERHVYASGRENRLVSYIAGGVLVVLVFGRMLLVWAREWDRKRVLRHERPLGGTT